MTHINLYRGIAIKPSEKDEFLTNIRTHGITGTETRRINSQQDPELIRKEITKYKNNPELMSSIPRDVPVICCASGSQFGALYYATRHNISTSKGETLSVEIEFRAPIDNLCIDGNDFLFTIFAKTKKKYDAGINIEKECSAIEKIFGPTCREYLQIALEKPAKQINNLVDIVRCDPVAIKEHANNNNLIEGRYNICFHSAFHVLKKIPPQDIGEISFSKKLPSSTSPYYRLQDY